MLVPRGGVKEGDAREGGVNRDLELPGRVGKASVRGNRGRDRWKLCCRGGQGVMLGRVIRWDTLGYGKTMGEGIHEGGWWLPMSGRPRGRGGMDSFPPLLA